MKRIDPLVELAKSRVSEKASSVARADVCPECGGDMVEATSMGIPVRVCLEHQAVLPVLEETK